MKTCAVRNIQLATPIEHLFMLLLIELTLYVKPCAMEMPALLAALLQETGSRHHMAYGELTDALLTPPSLPADVTPAEATSINELELNERKELLNGALDKPVKNEDNFEVIMPAAMATAGVPTLKETMQHKMTASSATSSSSSSMRHCSIEIITKVPGICQAMPHAIGSACVAGDYMDLFNMECMNGY